MPDFFDFREQFIRRPQQPGINPGENRAASSRAGNSVPEMFSVSQLTRIIESAIQSGVPSRVLVHGEISNVSARHASGHLYFTLKDNNCCIDCVMWKSDFERLKFEPRDGEAVLVSGGVQVYGVRGRYQLYAKSIEPMGQGALELAYRQLYAKLEAEGLFDRSRKKILPRYPMRIALATSKDGAALQDILKVLRRFPWVKTALHQVPVQGSGAGGRIAEALNALSRQAARQQIDLVVLARGGGSIEDLWAFNEEVVARAIVACSVPVITGIGHEVDTSIADLVADHHAHTPTEAAQVAVANWRTAADELDVHALRLRRAMRAIVIDGRQRLSLIDRHELFRRPLDRVNQLRQRLDDRQRGLSGALKDQLRRAERTLASRQERLRRHHPRHALRLIDQALRAGEGRLRSAMAASMARLALRLDSEDAHLQAVSPQAVLKRGYSITTHKRGGAVVRSIHDVRSGDAIITRVGDGPIESTVEDQNQPRLFE